LEVNEKIYTDAWLIEYVSVNFFVNFQSRIRRRNLRDSLRIFVYFSLGLYFVI